MLLLLRQRERVTAAEFARDLEVSVRTVHRDIEALSIAGLPVYAERGPRGGFRLLEGTTPDLVGLSERERQTLDLLLDGVPVDALGLGAERRSLQQKIGRERSVRPSGVRSRAAAESWRGVPALRALRTAIEERREVDVTGPDGGALRLQPWGLLHHVDGWSVIGRTGEATISVPIAEDGRVRVLGSTFEAPSDTELIAAWRRLEL
jgi:predicted DNA-binding transcriptional regulator YafY